MSIRLYVGTIGCYYETMDWNGYRGWLTNDATSTVYFIRTVLNSAVPLKKGDSVTYSLNDGKEAINVTT